MTYYTYIHFTLPDRKIFYVGKTKNISRLFSKQKRNKQWHEWAKNFWMCQIVESFDTDKEACKNEKELIKTLKNLNHPLVNITDGGNGKLGLKWDEKFYKKIKPKLIINGKKGGSSNSIKKQNASKTNGKLGGRPRKVTNGNS